VWGLKRPFHADHRRREGQVAELEKEKKKNPDSRDNKDVIDIFNGGELQGWAGTLVVPKDDKDGFLFYTLTTNGKNEYDGYKNHGNTISGTKIAALDKSTKETAANDTLQKAILAALDYKEDPEIETLNNVVIKSSEASTEMRAIADKLRTMLIKIKGAANDRKIATDLEGEKRLAREQGLAEGQRQAAPAGSGITTASAEGQRQAAPAGSGITTTSAEEATQAEREVSVATGTALGL
jgi:hypothetical protein